MKIIKILALLFVLALAFSGCSEKAAPKLTAFKTSADLTHDGESEAIVTSIKGADEGEAFVLVYSKYEDWTPIYKILAGTKKKDQKGIYVCKKGGKYCLLIWRPTFDKEKKETTLEYSVVALTYDAAKEEGSTAELESGSITYTASQVEKDGDKYHEASKFVSKLNRYIEKSAALLDTVGGDVVYSPDSKTKEQKFYYPEWYDKDYKTPSTVIPKDTASK